MKKIAILVLVIATILVVAVNIGVYHDTNHWDKKDLTVVYFPKNTNWYFYNAFGTTGNGAEKFEVYLFTSTNMVRLVKYFKYPGAETGNWEFGERNINIPTQ